MLEVVVGWLESKTQLVVDVAHLIAGGAVRLLRPSSCVTGRPAGPYSLGARERELPSIIIAPYQRKITISKGATLELRSFTSSLGGFP